MAQKEWLISKAKELMEENYCCEEAKQAVQAWIDALGSEAEHAKAEALIKELEEDIMSVDDLFAFATSQEGKAKFGEATCLEIVEHATQLREAGKQICDCPACTAAEALLQHKEDLLA